MIQIVKGRYGYVADDGTVKIAEPGKTLFLSKNEEERLVRIGCAITLEEEAAKKKPSIKEEETPMQTKLRRKKGRKQ